MALATNSTRFLFYSSLALRQIKQRPRVGARLRRAPARALALLLEGGDEAGLAHALAHERDLEHALGARLQLLPGVRDVDAVAEAQLRRDPVTRFIQQTNV